MRDIHEGDLVPEVSTATYEVLVTEAYSTQHAELRYERELASLAKGIAGLR